MEKETKIIDSFTGKYRFLSNFSLHGFWCDGFYWRTNEHYYQAMKSDKFLYQNMIRLQETPRDARKLGQNIPLRENWGDRLKDHYMTLGLVNKFLQNEDALIKLCETQDSILIEGNNWGDTYWGVCNEEGKNRLGELLMGIRKALLMEKADFCSVKDIIDRAFGNSHNILY